MKKFSGRCNFQVVFFHDFTEDSPVHLNEPLTIIRGFKKTMPADNKIISICLMGRNDDYAVNFKRRLELSINYLALNAKKINVLDAIEIILVDWNSNVALYKELKLSKEARSITKTIIVPPEEAAKYNFKDSNFSHVYPINIGLRRSSGKYLTMMPADVLISSYTLERIYRLLCLELDVCFDPEKVIMAVPRKFIPSMVEDDLFSKTPEKLDKFFLFNDWYFENEIPHPGILGGHGMMIFHKSVFSHLKGLNENLGGWGLQDTEFGIRGNCYYPIINLSSLGIFVYDFKSSAKGLYEKLDRANSLDDIKFDINSNTWGMKDREFGTVELKNRPSTQLKYKSTEEKGICNNFITSFDDNKKLFKLIFKNIHKIDNLCLITYLLAKFSLYKKPLKYLEIGSDKYYSKIISIINPLSELYFIPSSKKSDNTFNNKYKFFINTSKYSKHMGWIRYIPGNPYTGLERLKQSFIGEMHFDLILFNDRFDKVYEISLKEQLISYLSDRGVILFLAENQDKFISTKQNLENKYPTDLLITDQKYKICIFVKGVTTKNQSDSAVFEKTIFGHWVFIYEIKIFKYLFKLIRLAYIYWSIFRGNKRMFIVKLFFKVKRIIKYL